MEQRFGQVENGLVHLNDAGIMAHRLWIENGNRYGDVLLDAFVLMPNHLHAIVIIGSDPRERTRPTSLDSVVGSFKSVTTIEYGRGVRAGAFPPYERAFWQRGFHDRILRNDHELDVARSYIEGNPGRWTEREGSLGRRDPW
jgi:REP element-mobilizing transposase RayT